jgi:hypothetical protein
MSRVVFMPHLLYLFKNYDYRDLDYRAVAVMMSSQVYLMINLRFSNQVYDDLADTKQSNAPPPSIQIASGVFDVIKLTSTMSFDSSGNTPGRPCNGGSCAYFYGTGESRPIGVWSSRRGTGRALVIHLRSFRCPTQRTSNCRTVRTRIQLNRRIMNNGCCAVTTKGGGDRVNAQLIDFTLQV